MDKLQEIKSDAGTLRLKNTRDNLENMIREAENSDCSYLEFIHNVLKNEILYRQQRAQERRIKEAGFPYEKKLKDFDIGFSNALSKKQFNQLCELTWIDGVYNLILSGPPGVGKTHLAIGLGYLACENGYRVSYTTMQGLIRCLKTEEIDRRSRIKMNRIRKSHLLVIDEIGYLPVNVNEGNLFFQLVTELQEQTSIVMTTNKGFDQWSEFLTDPALATAILDRLSFRCDRIMIDGDSYRLQHRKTYLKND